MQSWLIRALGALISLTLLVGCSGGNDAIPGASQAAARDSTIQSLEPRASMSTSSLGAQAHVYVGSDDAVFRYETFKGVPKHRPDLMLPGVSGPVAASPLDGRSNVVYAQSPIGIKAFADGSNVASREIILPILHQQSQFWVIVGMVVDRDGYLYVGLQQQNGGDQAGGADLPKPQQAVFVYRPHAHGLAQPLRVIRNIEGNFEGLGLDSRGELLLLSETDLFVGLCEVVADPRTNPHAVGTFRSRVLGTTYGATVTGDDLYVSTFVPNPYRFVVAVFPVSSRGVVLPERSISAKSGTITGPIVEFHNTLFVASINSDNALWLYEGCGSGGEMPFEKIYFRNGVSGVAVGQ